MTLMEANHPDIRFDWRQILDGEGEPPPVPPQRPSRESATRIAPSDAAAVNDVSIPTPPAQPVTATSDLNPDTLSRLRARYTDVVARIARRIADPARAEAVKAAAARLDPDTWLTPADVKQGLEQYESRFESLRGLLGRRRRRRRPQGPQQTSAEDSRAGDEEPTIDDESGADSDVAEERAEKDSPD